MARRVVTTVFFGAFCGLSALTNTAIGKPNSEDIYVYATKDPTSSPLTASKKDGDSKVYSFDDWNSDNKIKFSNSRLTLIHNVPANLPSTMSVRLSFHQYNQTENDKGQHEAGVSIQLLGASGNILAVVFGGNNIVRDRCGDMGDILLGPTNVSDEIYDLVTSARMSYSAHWNYEGGC